ncbi:MAG: hypothetical protein JWP27_1782 [Flaviaesturariibacter sp.]|nr:hypothetical protein [Flaviaesturariibacter sp.]
MKRYSHLWFVAVVVLLPVLSFGVVRWTEQRYKKLPVFYDGVPIASFRLKDQSGNIVTEKSWNGKIVVAHYFFTHCPAVCPRMIYQLKRVQAYAAAPNLLLASFTVDPERDSTGRLRSYASQSAIGGSWQLLTGDKPQLYRLARKSFRIDATDGDGGPGDFIHSDKLVLIDTNGRIRGYYDGTDEASVNNLVEAIGKLADE